MSENQVYGVVLPPETAHKARVVAALEGKSRSQLIRDLLENYLRGYDSPKSIRQYHKSSQENPRRF